MKEITSLIKRAQRYLKSAKLLLKEGDNESSVSRIYYAMFYSVQALLLTKNLSFSSHKGVISAFGEQYVKTGIFPNEMSRELTRAFEKRQAGDYEYTFVISAEEAEMLFGEGRDFVDRIIKYLKLT
ncbi:HEPN domain-containing protein [candidate division WOR-3 bacterium]|uniref:HEPN domain-containing protein n=1 Tax=candidate division WOR-3 bacterium TaxID=2052148 RepID=A0A9D5KA78_UNCW3|nr:HEPN domain-containing protein [candidate division WOR-3 bacterium]MBD3365317.1 HEPN domain-containing protein [candidate division WOR-3 bacterium]